MTSHRNQHYVPQFYLRRFCDSQKPPRLWVHEPGRAEPYRASPRRIAALPDFYRVENVDKEEELIVERMLGDVESRVPPVITRLEAKQTLTDDEREVFAVFVALAQTRVPSFRENLDDFAIRAGKMVLRAMATDINRFKASLGRFEQETGERVDIPAEDLREFILDERRYTMQVTRNWSLTAMVKALPTIVPFLLRMHWTFLHGIGQARFITSDNPALPFFRVTDYGRDVLAADRFVPHDPAGLQQSISKGKEVLVA